MTNRPITRRQMVASSLAGNIALGFSHRLPAAEGMDPVSFIIVSDTHLGRNDNASAERQWRQAVAEINNLPGTFVLHLGDIVDKGREAQYPIYLESKRQLDKPIHEIPGNHDPDGMFRKYIREQIDRSVDDGGLRFLLLDNARRDSHDGFLTPAQIQWIDEQCADAATLGLKIVICCHVPIHTNKNPDRGWYVKPAEGQTAFYELHQRHASHILACLHGHFHNGIRGWRDHEQTVEVLCPSVCYNQNRSLTEHIANGRAAGFFIDELRPGFVQAELGRGRLTMRYKPLGQPSIGRYSATWG